MVVGFGCNVYGRFSLAGAYDPKLGTWRCEKKYMLSKFGIKSFLSKITIKLLFHYIIRYLYQVVHVNILINIQFHQIQLLEKLTMNICQHVIEQVQLDH